MIRNKEDIFKVFLQSVQFLACAKHMYMTLPQWKRFSFWRLFLFMFLCFSHKYRIQNKLSKTVEIELETVFSKKKGIFLISWIPKTTPSKFNLRKTRQKSNKSYKMRNCKKSQLTIIFPTALPEAKTKKSRYDSKVILPNAYITALQWALI